MSHRKLRHADRVAPSDKSLGSRISPARFRAEPHCVAGLAAVRAVSTCRFNAEVEGEVLPVRDSWVVVLIRAVRRPMRNASLEHGSNENAVEPS